MQSSINALLDADLGRDHLVISHGVSRPLHYAVTELLEKRAARNEKCTVFLSTFGGDPNGGYRLARCLRHYYTHIRLVVPSFCKSAGTLIAVAADELAIGDLGELGPLDIQVRKGSELQEQSSGLDIMQALQLVTTQTQDAFRRMMLQTRGLGLSTKLCAEFASSVASSIAQPLLAQIDPIRLGEMQRATRVAYEYGQRLDVHSSNLQDNALERLVSEYPAHGFVIDRKEAGQLFKRVSHPTDEEKVFFTEWWDVFKEQCDIPPFMLERRNLSEEQADDRRNQENLRGPEEVGGTGDDSGEREPLPASGDQQNSAGADE